jgi:hypothetical protein
MVLSIKSGMLFYQLSFYGRMADHPDGNPNLGLPRTSYLDQPLAFDARCAANFKCKCLYNNDLEIYSILISSTAFEEGPHSCPETRGEEEYPSAGVISF